ncbi:MAG: hypothetical protein ACI4GB_08090 [Acutalibacteraceae bacterium]
MKLYLSKYWKDTCMFGFFIILMIIVSTISFCIWSHDDEDYLLIIGALIFISIFGYLMYVSLKLVRYTITENEKVTMYSFNGNQLCSIDLDKDVYYEVLTLIEGAYSKKKFIIISNERFDPYRKSTDIGLAKICKLIDINKKQIILPYEKPALALIGFATWHNVAICE